MFIRKNWLPISVFLLAIVAVGLYLLTTLSYRKILSLSKNINCFDNDWAADVLFGRLPFCGETSL